MVKPQKQTQHHHHTTSTRKLSCLFSCFGFSGKVSDNKSGDGKRKRRMSWFFRSKSKNSVTCKTVPVDVSPEKFKPRSPVQAQVKTKTKSKIVKSKSSKLQDKDKLWDISQTPVHDPLPADLDINNSINNNSQEIKYESKDDKILPGNKNPTTDSSTKDDASQRRPSQKPKTKYKSASSHGKGSNSLEVHPPAMDTLVAQSTSFNSQEQPQKKNNDDRARELDSLVGLSVIMVTLIVMVLWGKLCAILCTSAWLYFISFYRNSVTSNAENTNKTKMIEEEERIAGGSMEYKRRVVLEGFLKRSGRS